MALTDALLPEFDRETNTTRKLLERVPGDRFAWKPHDKSMSLGQLASHLATMVAWGHVTLNQPELDLTGGFMPTELTTTADLLSVFDREVATTRTALAGATDTQLMAPWSLKRDGKTMFTMPRVAVLRTFVLNHMIHHRGQLSVYLRLNHVPLPSIYGPSADEQP